MPMPGLRKVMEIPYANERDGASATWRILSVPGGVCLVSTLPSAACQHATLRVACQVGLE